MSTESASASSSRPCLLLVDDTPANIDVLVGVLKADYTLKVANRGAKALKICEGSEPIDLILLDVMMPEMDGFEVCRVLRATPATKDVPIIFLTAKTDTDDIVQGFELGANDYLTKPFRPAELIARVKTHLMVRAQQREIQKKNIELKETLQLVCHDVANQFAVIGMSIELLQNHPGQSFERFLPRIAAATRNGSALTSLVRDMRRAEDKGVVLEPVSVRAAFDEALLLAEDRVNKKELRVVADLPDIRVLAEPASLTNSVFGNVLSNAIKFSARGDVIEISAEAGPGTVCVRMRDHGIGMPPAFLENLFDVGHSHSRKGTDGEKGTGFGMPLMRKFVLQYGGDVKVVSRDQATHPDDHGTEFLITLKTA